MGPLSSGNYSAGSVADGEFEGANASDWAGNRVGWGGDTNADGYDDCLVGAPDESSNGASSGAAYLVLGSASSTGTLSVSSADALIFGINAGDSAGGAINGLGDTDGDSYDDIAIAVAGAG